MNGASYFEEESWRDGKIRVCFESVQFFSLSLGYSLVSFRPDNRVGRDTSGEAETCVLFREYAEFCARSN